MAKPARKKTQAGAGTRVPPAKAAAAPAKERVFRHAADPATRPPPPKSNGGPKVYESLVEEMRDIGMTLYAPDPWVPRLARDIGEHPRQVWRWVKGEAELTPIAMHRTRQLIKEHIKRLNKLLVRIGDGEA